jgi:hypothetical protein
LVEGRGIFAGGEPWVSARGINESVRGVVPTAREKKVDVEVEGGVARERERRRGNRGAARARRNVIAAVTGHVVDA